jgi:hypothetical protein
MKRAVLIHSSAGKPHSVNGVRERAMLEKDLPMSILSDRCPTTVIMTGAVFADRLEKSTFRWV